MAGGGADRGRLVVPVLVVFRAPLGVWRFMAAGLFGCELAFGVLIGSGYNDVAWPWPVFGMAAFGLALFAVASRCDRVTVGVVGVVTVLAGRPFRGAGSTPVSGILDGRRFHVTVPS